MFDAVFPLLVIFLVIVVPLWISFHYVTVWKRGHPTPGGTTSDAPADGQALADFSARAARMAERIDALEAILDAEVPGWRQRQ